MVAGRRFRDGTVEIRLQGRWADIVDGTRSVEDLDTEELARGQLKDKNGRFTGRPPKVIPRELLDAMRREHYQRVNGILEESLSDMVKTMRAIAMDVTADDGVRLRAAIYVYERFMGKVPDRVEVARSSKVDQVVEQIMYDMGESPIEREIADTEAEMDRKPARRSRTRRTRTQTRRTD